MRSCALLTVVAAASAQEFTRIPKDLSGLPHGLVVPETLRAPAHAEAHAAVARHAGRRDLGAAGRRACAARAELLRSLVAAGDLEAAVDLSLAADAATRAALPAGCVLEDRPHAGFADVVTKVQRKGMDGERISHVRLAAGEKFARVEPVGSRAFSGSMKQVPVVGFELNGTLVAERRAVDGTGRHVALREMDAEFVGQRPAEVAIQAPLVVRGAGVGPSKIPDEEREVRGAICSREGPLRRHVCRRGRREAPPQRNETSHFACPRTETLHARAMRLLPAST